VSISNDPCPPQQPFCIFKKVPRFSTAENSGEQENSLFYKSRKKLHPINLLPAILNSNFLEAMNKAFVTYATAATNQDNLQEDPQSSKRKLKKKQCQVMMKWSKKKLTSHFYYCTK
jgi:hypothetical protein